MMTPRASTKAFQRPKQGVGRSMDCPGLHSTMAVRSIAPLHELVIITSCIGEWLNLTSLKSTYETNQIAKPGKLAVAKALSQQYSLSTMKWSNLD